MNMFKNLMFCFQKVGEEIVFKHLRSTQDFSYTENMCITKLVGSNAYTNEYGLSDMKIRKMQM